MDSHNDTHMKRRNRWWLIGFAVALVGLLFSVQLMAADDAPLPTPVPEEGSPYSDRVATDKELQQAEPSLERYVEGHAITGAALLGANLEESSKEANRDEVPANGLVEYTIMARNTGDTDVPVTVTDVLPDDLEYVSHFFAVPIGGISTGGGFEEGTLTWEGILGTDGEVEIRLAARVKGDVEPGTTIANTAEITANEETLQREATITVVEAASSPVSLFPFIIRGIIPDPPEVTLQASRPTNANQWTVSWQSGPGATAYELQVALSPDFSDAQTLQVGQAQQRAFNPEPSFRNIYYYRARSTVGPVAGPWSNTIQVIGAYRDDFDDPTSGWSVRRTTFIEEVQSFYEIRNGDDWLILRVEDSWDWGIASPLVPAPEPPYVIEYEAKHANLGNLVSLGAVFGGDKPGTTCPDRTSADGWYRHELCFNHFYNTNIIYFGKLKMLFERVDKLVWCSNCGGSPMKRLGDIDPNGAVELSGVDVEGWNRVRIEVRQDGIKVFMGKRGGSLNLVKQYDDTRWIGNPFFGVFASTDEYSNSTARFEFFEVRTLDN